jgi:hypothetical protein
MAFDTSMMIIRGPEDKHPEKITGPPVTYRVTIYGNTKRAILLPYPLPQGIFHWHEIDSLLFFSPCCPRFQSP